MKKRTQILALILVIMVALAIYASYFAYYQVVIKPQEGKEKPLPYTTLLKFDGEVNFEVTTENGPANEVTIAVNPTDPNNLIAGAKDYTLGPRQGREGYRVWSGYYWSRDGGKTWGNGLMGYPDIENSVLGIYDEISDPVVAFGPDGTAYYSGLAINYESKLIPGFPPRFVHNGIYVAKSTDGGKTYSQITFVVESPDNNIFNDKQWFVVDPYNPQYIYVSWSIHTWAMDTGFQARVVLSRSTDGGRTWDPPRDISRTFEGRQQGSGTIPVVGPDGDIYVTWIDYNEGTLMLSKSRDQGLTWPIFSETIINVEILPYQMEGNEYRTPTIPSMAADRSKADTSGNLYIVWNDYHNGNSDIVLIRSEDGGNTWSDPIQVNDDLNSTADQFFPFISVSSNGDVHIVFYDKRDDPNNHLIDVFYAHSKDGKTFDPNWCITTNSSDPSYSYHQSGNVFIGDYIGIDSSDNYAYAIWADTRYGEADAFCAVIVGDVDE